MNRYTLSFAALMAFTVIFSACDSGSNTPQSNGNATPTNAENSSSTTTPAPGAPADNRPIVYLDGVYATSSVAGLSVENLFDTDPASGWRTQQGAGPDEGIMIYVSDRTDARFQAIELQPMDGSFGKTDEDNVEIFVDGQPAATGKVGTKIPLGKAANKKIYAIYVRFTTTGREAVSKRKQGDGDLTLSNFPKDASIGLKSLALYNDQGEPARLVAPKRVRGTATASSTLAPEMAYSVENLFDSRHEFVWVEGAANSGEGETLIFDFAEPVNITAIQIWNGYQRSNDHYLTNARAKDFSFGSKGGVVKTYTLADRKAGQKIAVSGQGTSFELKINSIFKGTKYKDLAISDIVFFDGDQPFVMSTGLGEKYEAQVRSRSNASPLAFVLNRRINNVLEMPGVKAKQSLILRSDGTFVLYNQEDYDGDANTNTIADGNWEMLESNGQISKVKVFGKWNDVTKIVEYYKGTGKQDVTKIFNDVLTIDAAQVRGEKMIGTFYVK